MGGRLVPWYPAWSMETVIRGSSCGTAMAGDALGPNLPGRRWESPRPAVVGDPTRRVLPLAFVQRGVTMVNRIGGCVVVKVCSWEFGPDCAGPMRVLRGLGPGRCVARPGLGWRSNGPWRGLWGLAWSGSDLILGVCGGGPLSMLWIREVLFSESA